MEWLSNSFDFPRRNGLQVASAVRKVVGGQKRKMVVDPQRHPPVTGQVPGTGGGDPFGRTNSKVPRMSSDGATVAVVAAADSTAAAQSATSSSSSSSEPLHSLRRTVFAGPSPSKGGSRLPLAWNANVEFLRRRLKELTPAMVSSWSVRRVARFIDNLPGVGPSVPSVVVATPHRNGGHHHHHQVNGVCGHSPARPSSGGGLTRLMASAGGSDDEDEAGQRRSVSGLAARFVEEEIDGEALLMLTQDDLLKVLGLKLGPALKVVNAILLIKSNKSSSSTAVKNGGGGGGSSAAI